MVRGWIVLLVLFSNPFCDFLLFLFPNFDDEGRKSEGGGGGGQEGEGMILVVITKWMDYWPWYCLLAVLSYALGSNPGE